MLMAAHGITITTSSFLSLCISFVYVILWLSGCCGSVAEHWQLKPEVSWVRLPATAGFFTFLYFRLITSKFIYFQREARCSELHLHVHNLITNPSTTVLLQNVHGVNKKIGELAHKEIHMLGVGRIVQEC